MLLESHLKLSAIQLRPGAEMSLATGSLLFLLLEAGLGYWLSGKHKRELNPGDVLLLHGGCRGILRASQLAALSARWFIIDPQMINGMITLEERSRLKKFAGQEPGEGVVYAREHELPAQFARVLATESELTDLTLRCQLLALLAPVLAVADTIRGEPRAETQGKYVPCVERFQDLSNQMIAEDLLKFNLPQLAAHCGCGVRHLSRLFRVKYGRPFRSVQTEMRLQKARRLLQETGAKIIDIAFESGYRHLGLFNSLFKQHYGMTPSAWRQHSAAMKSRGSNL